MRVLHSQHNDQCEIKVAINANYVRLTDATCRLGRVCPLDAPPEV